MTLRLWCEHAWLGGPSASDGVLLDIDGERFASVELGVATPPNDAVRLPGLTFPGFVNPHFSVMNRMLRGRDRGSHPMLSAAITAGLSPDLLLVLARACYAELAIAGYTTVGEFHTIHHAPNGTRYSDPNVLSVVLMEAAKQAGVRLGVIDVCSVGTGSRTSDEGVNLWVERLDPFADGLRTRSDVRIVAGVADLDILPGRSLADVSLWAGQSGLALHAIASGTRVDGTSVLSALGTSGVMSNRGGFTAIGANGSTPSEIEALGQQRGYVLIDTAAPFQQFAYASLRMAGGRAISAQSGPGAPDPFAALRHVGHTASADPKCAGLGWSELLRSATVDAAASLGWRDSGLLASGQLADLVTVNLVSPRLAGLDRDDLLGAVVSHATPSDISHVAVGGKLVVDGGRHTLGNIGALLDDAVRTVLAASPIGARLF
jgi:cytosine/adenosine deaminase-related metal-dependent hydrolase